MSNSNGSGWMEDSGSSSVRVTVVDGDIRCCKCGCRLSSSLNEMREHEKVCIKKKENETTKADLLEI